ncbi:MAG: hypothetical protein ACC619_00080 [Paracoccaceae bacterium]
MPIIDPENLSLSSAFAAGAKSDFSVRMLDTWNRNLYRETRLLVPVDVQALVVAPGDKIERADIAGPALFGILRERAENPDIQALDATPRPFADLEPRAPGVYLHWALPDGLTAGTVEADDQAQESPDGTLVMRALPNRWVVLRVEQGTSRRVRGWVIEAERGRVVDLDDWAEVESTEEGRTPELLPRELTAVAGGDPAWAATFDTVEDRFAFHDDLADIPGNTRPLTYLVAGWYSETALDPLDDATTETQFETNMEALRWCVDSAQIEKARNSALAESLRRASIGQQSVSLPDRRIDTQTDIGTPYKTLELRFDRLPWWPRQSLYHGVIYGVSFAKSRRRDPRPRPQTLDISVGQTGAESLAALVADSLDVAEREEGERLHTAFQYSMADLFDDSDGIPRLEEEIHRRAFESQSGGHILERVRDGDRFAHLRPTPPNRWTDQLLDTPLLPESVVSAFSRRQGATDFRASIASDTQKSSATVPRSVGGQPVSTARQQKKAGAVVPVAQSDVLFEFTRSGRYDVQIQQDYKLALRDRIDFDKIQPDAQISQQIRFKEVRRALPRFFYPQDPVLTFNGLRRNLRHGYDGRFDAEDKVDCRLTGNTVTCYSGLVAGADLMARRLDHGSLPREIAELLNEVVLEDNEAVNDIATVAARKTGISKPQVRTRVLAEDRYFLRTQQPQPDAVDLGFYSIKCGVSASPLGVTYWRQAWVPLYVEWEIELGVDDQLTRWQLGELDFESENPAPAVSSTFRGRAILNSAGAKALTDGIVQFLAEEEKLDDDEDSEGVIDKETADLLGNLSRQSPYTDMLSAAVEGLRDRMLGFETTYALGDENDSGDADPALARPTNPPQLLRGGVMRFSRLRIVDAFGRVLEIPPARLNAIRRSDAMQTPDSTDLLLPPRIMQPSRLWLRFVDASNDQQDAHVDQSTDAGVRNPIGAWLLPDHVDRALEVFSSDGVPLGQLRHVGHDRAVTWEGAPGQPEPLGTSPGTVIGDRHTAEFARTLIERDATEREQLEQADNSDRETPLSSLLRAIDTTLWTVDPFGQHGTEFYSVLTGRPIAVVRARLKLEVLSDLDNYKDLDEELQEARVRAYEALSSREFEVRLGALTRFEDGLLGYFVDDNYRQFYPVHNAVSDEARVAARHEGFMGPIDQVDEFSAELPVKKIVNPYVMRDPTVTLRPGQSVKLTLLMDPGVAVHATCGALPRKSIKLPRVFTESALARISPSFRFGPVLVDPNTVRMPKPRGLPEDQIWTHRDTPVSWRDDPITAATQDAFLPDESPIAQEGYIRVNIDPSA